MKPDMFYKTSNIETGSINFFPNISTIASYFKVKIDNVLDCIYKPGDKHTKVLNKQYHITRIEHDPPVLTKEEIYRVQNTAPFSIVAYNYLEGRVFIFGNSAEFAEYSKISKSLVNAVLAKGHLVTVSGWTILYFNNENSRTILSYVKHRSSCSHRS